MTRRQHRRLHKAIDAWVDGELDHAESRAITAHVHDCWNCSAAAETARLIKRSLRGLREREPAGLAATRLQRFAQQLVGP